MGSILASITPRQIVAPDDTYMVRPPTLREAIVVMEAAPIAATGDDDARLLLIETMREWFPKKLFLATSKAGAREMAMTCMQLVRIYEEEKEREKSEERADWYMLISMYMSAYGRSFNEVLSEPWPAFLEMSKRITMHEARAQVGIITANGIPHIRKDEERSRAIHELMQKAGMERKPRKVQQSEADANLKWMELMFAQAGALGKA